MKKLYVEIKEKNKKILLSKYLSNIFKSMPYSAFCRALRNKDIRINNIRTSVDVEIKNGDILDIYINDNILFNIPKEIKYYYEDDNILVAFKPIGILSNNEDEKIVLQEPTFEEIVIKDKYNLDLKIVHRLDRNTSGLVIFSKNETTNLELIEGFKENCVKKEYIAYVSGTNFTKKNDILEGYLLKDNQTGFCKVTTYETRFSEKVITEYCVLETNTDLDYSKLLVKLHTGKTHQIRSHLSSIGHPIIGDSKYGTNDINRKFKKKFQMLYACKYTFNFDKSSMLNYLNEITIELERERTEFK